jgi:hypothetical protein
MSDAIARSIFFDRSQLLRPLAEIDRLIQQRKRLRPAQRRLLRERARRLWEESSTSDHDRAGD